MSGNVSNHVWVIDTTNSRGGYWQRAKGSSTGVADVSDETNASGILRTWHIDVVAATLPVEATSGVMVLAAGFRNPTITSVLVTAGTMPLVAFNPTIRWSTAPNDGAAALALPTTFPTHSKDPITGELGSFDLDFVYSPDTEAAGELRVCVPRIPSPGIELVMLTPIQRLNLAHNITGVTLRFGISAAEEV